MQDLDACLFSFTITVKQLYLSTEQSNELNLSFGYQTLERYKITPARPTVMVLK